MRRIKINDTEDAVAEIAALATKVIAAGGHKGHDLESVGEVMTSDVVLDTIRRSFTRNRTEGMSVRDAFIATGQTCVAHYCNRAGVPTSREA